MIDPLKILKWKYVHLMILRSLKKKTMRNLKYHQEHHLVIIQFMNLLTKIIKLHIECPVVHSTFYSSS